MRHLKKSGVRLAAVAASGLLVLTACGGGGSVSDATEENESKAAEVGGDCGEFNILVHPWVGYTADAYVVGAVAAEELGCTVEGRPGRGASPLPVTIGTYDGDTPQARRGRLRQHGQIILTNPDMLHQGILPHHARWNRFFSRLRYVVIDEVHAYRGVFGSHLSCVLRRLERICRHYGASPQFICCSATISAAEINRAGFSSDVPPNL